MHLHHVRTHRSDENLAREGQLAWKLAGVATDPVELDDDVIDMVVNRVIDNAAVAAASIAREPVVVGAQPGAVAPGLDRRRRCDRVRCRCGAPHLARVGRMGQRGRRARTRLPRHLPRG